ncbi:VanW family protein [Corynebacterium caspium]|uniref:VanW family protein n=1 Tax=Corynebacterium caspium TaxID=234828 RepID=UPI00037FC8A2|nr:VanW family protein [Corynebacterium caspium]WKD59951.1 Vancomycin B-type resistance protein VanW [Corynebacterium caspium DSM 44850]
MGIFALTAVAYAVDIAISRDNVPRGATVGGVEIGGLPNAAAAEVLETQLGQIATQPVHIQTDLKDPTTAIFTPEAVGITPDWEATIAGAGEQSWNPFKRLAGFFRSYELPVVSLTDETLLHTSATDLATELSREPVDGTIRIAETGTVETTPAVTGITVVAADLEHEMGENWANPAGITVSATTVEPSINDAEVQKIATGPAAIAASGALKITGEKDITAILEPAEIGEILHFEPVAGQLQPKLDIDGLTERLKAQLAASETVKRNAQISGSGANRVVTPHSDGLVVDWPSTLEGIEDRIIGKESKEFKASYIEDPATFTTTDAKNASFDQVVGEFTTSGFSGPSGTNIALTANIVNGAIIAPGDIFSLNSYTGPRGKAQGFVESGVILNGHADTAVGGGISQFATTLYNAAYFAALEDITHRPHSYYISRYPAGREATVFEGAIDLAFRNTSAYPIQIISFVQGNSVTVRLMGVKTHNVESINGGRWAPTQPKTIELKDPKCSPSSGAPGFTTSDTRIIRTLSGAEVSRETTTTVYDPSPIVRCL